MDCNSIEIWVTRGVVQKVVDSPICLGGDISSLTRDQPRDVQAHTQHQHTENCQISGHTEETERERGGAGGCYTPIAAHSHEKQGSEVQKTMNRMRGHSVRHMSAFLLFTFQN